MIPSYCTEASSYNTNMSVVMLSRAFDDSFGKMKAMSLSVNKVVMLSRAFDDSFVKVEFCVPIPLVCQS